MFEVKDQPWERGIKQGDTVLSLTGGGDWVNWEGEGSRRVTNSVNRTGDLHKD